MIKELKEIGVWNELVKAVTKPRVPQEEGKFLSS